MPLRKPERPCARKIVACPRVFRDTMLAVMMVFYEGFNNSKYRPAPLLKEMLAAG